MAARKRKHHETLKSYRENLKSEDAGRNNLTK